MWKALVEWVRDRVVVDVDVDLDGKLVSVSVRARFADTTVIAERFDWTLPIVGQKATLNTGTARRRSVLPEGA
jgi:hypothetical protein